ncbi:baculoviral IAP repeat-containing protein 5 [Ooceraea biroi]|uniref:Baculoviral IAP repeat-containing protein n=1 Tax=Ooceraea biroi TaxID=2015173 RepID=A0A026WRP9_OOCBI|nr:baculoviral IAP repeat-containing protein 5 [Ooceraea biroi]EZA58697.1 Baculoviral IAP repeat-containing protein [Ooceraea biroi]
MEITEATAFFWKMGRIKTYDKWPFKQSDKCNVECMAAAGFYSIGNDDDPDLVECFICGKQLDGWEPLDDPWSEHIKHNSDCPYVKLNKQDEKDWTIEEMYDMFKKYKIREYMHELDKSIITLKEEAAHLKSNLEIVHKRSRKSKKSTS